MKKPKKPKYRLSTWMISDELYTWIRENLETNSEILELGSGLGSVALSQTYRVTSIENNIMWIGLGRNINYLYVPLSDTWYDRKEIKRKISSSDINRDYFESYDLLLVDGPPQDLRLGILDNFDLFRTDRPVIFDDTQRPEVLKVAKEIARRYGFKLINIRTKGQLKNFAILQPNPNLKNNGPSSST